MKEIYAIVFKETGEIVAPDLFKKYWKNYGSNSLYGWNPPKKIYYTLGRARSGFAHIPNEIKDDLAIAKFIFGEIVEDGAELKEKQDKARKKKRGKKRKNEKKGTWYGKRLGQKRSLKRRKKN